MFSTKMQYITKKDLVVPRRLKTSRKGDNGNVVVIGGSTRYVGAVALAGLAALRCGVDSVHIIAPRNVAWAVNCLSADLVTTKISGSYFTPKHISGVLKSVKRAGAILIGNGIGQQSDTKQFIRKIISKIDKPLVVDADGIKAVSVLQLKNTIITPHIREFELFLKNSHRDTNTITKIRNQKNLEKKSLLIRKVLGKRFFERNNVIILKGPVDIILSCTKTYYNKTGNAGMTKAGTGDVLAGLAVGFLAQKKDVRKSAMLAAYYSGLAGDILARKKKGFTYLASDLAEEIELIRKNLNI